MNQSEYMSNPSGRRKILLGLWNRVTNTRWYIKDNPDSWSYMNPFYIDHNTIVFNREFSKKVYERNPMMIIRVLDVFFIKIIEDILKEYNIDTIVLKEYASIKKYKRVNDKWELFF